MIFWFPSHDQVSYKIIDVAEMFTDNIIMLPERRGERFASEKFESDTESILGWKPKYHLKDYIEQIKDN